MDTLTPTQRSALMSRVRGKDTGPELIVRRLLHGLGYRYVLHDPRLPGKPDLVFPSRGKAIMVHGCFWHRHQRCTIARLPKSRQDFWQTKLEANRTRDRRQLSALRRLGWKILVVWECQLSNKSELVKRLTTFLETPNE